MMKKWMMAGLVMLCIIVLITGCKEKKEPIDLFRADLDHYYGTVDNGVFQNDFAHISMTIPDDWNIVEDQMKQQMELMAEQVLEKNPEAYEKMALEDVQVYNMLFLFKYPIENRDKFNPSLLSIVERLGEKSIANEEAYLDASKELMASNDLPMGFEYDFKDGYQKVQIGGENFTVMEVALQTSITDVTQKYFALQQEDKVLSFVVSYSTDEEQQELMKILNTLAFNE